MWASAIIAATVASAVVIWGNWTRYNENPTVMALEKNYREWNITFPAGTVCYEKNINYTIASDYIFREWGAEENTTQFRYYLSFLESIANISCYEFYNFRKYTGDKSLEKQDMSKIAKQIALSMMNVSIGFSSASNNVFHETLTEEELCHTYNGFVSNHITLKKNAVTKNLTILKCHYVNRQCFVKIEDLPERVKYSVHSPYEISDSLDKRYRSFMDQMRPTILRFQETVASPYLWRLDPKQRKCRYVDEPTTGPVYSHTLCRMQCRKRLALKLCGCVPYTYLPEPNIPVCGISGLACLSSHTDDVVALRTNGIHMDCDCSPLCEDTIYYYEDEEYVPFTYTYIKSIKIKWGIQNYSKTRMRRDIIFTFEDLLVSLEGTAAFFLGCSVITIIEIAYHFTIRLCFFLYRNVIRDINK